MDPLAALKAEITKKRKQQSLDTPSTPTGRPSKRWKTRAEIEADKRKERLGQEKQATTKKNEESERKLKEIRPQAQQAISGPPEKKGTDDGIRYCKTDNGEEHKPVEERGCGNHATCADDPPVSKEEVVKRLRSLREPITLFGEMSWDRFNRMRELELAREEVSKGQKNVFQKKMREMEAKDAEDDMYRYTGVKLPHFDASRTAGEAEKDKDVHEDQAPTCKEDYVYLQLRKYMRLWSYEIDAMSKEEKRTKKGRSLAVTYEQTKDWLKPLFKLLRKKKLARDVLDGLNSIFEAAAEREYVRANSLYLERLAIGNAPWPMGATMVGIHARAAREKIGEDKIAHVMNDEKTRKYIQAVKRLLTVAQRHFPTSFSKMVG